MQGVTVRLTAEEPDVLDAVAHQHHQPVRGDPGGIGALRGVRLHSSELAHEMWAKHAMQAAEWEVWIEPLTEDESPTTPDLSAGDRSLWLSTALATSPGRRLRRTGPATGDPGPLLSVYLTTQSGRGRGLLP